MVSRSFNSLLDQMRAIHDKKAHDYSNDNDPYSNFNRAAVITSWFSNPVDQVFASLIGVKIARLAELANGKTPNNESIDDTHLDLTVYCGLWASWRLDSRLNEMRKREVAIESDPNQYRGHFGQGVMTPKDLENKLIQGIPVQGETLSGSRVVHINDQELPVLCSACTDVSSIVYFHHAFHFHKAIYTSGSGTIKFPSLPLIPLTPANIKEVEQYITNQIR